MRFSPSEAASSSAHSTRANFSRSSGEEVATVPVLDSMAEKSRVPSALRLGVVPRSAADLLAQRDDLVVAGLRDLDVEQRLGGVDGGARAGVVGPALQQRDPGPVAGDLLARGGDDRGVLVDDLGLERDHLGGDHGALVAARPSRRRPEVGHRLADAGRGASADDLAADLASESSRSWRTPRRGRRGAGPARRGAARRRDR